MRLLVLASCLLLAACGGYTLSGQAERPVSIECRGKATISIVGSAGPSAGLNGAITADCGADGASIKINHE